MLEFIRIQNFKALRNAQFELGALNLFSGLNGMGKSTVIQALLLLRQSFERNMLAQGGLILNDKFIEIGTGADALAEHAEEEVLVFDIDSGEGTLSSFRFTYSAASDYLHQIKPLVTAPELTRHVLFARRFQYLAAERIGPRTAYPLSAYHVESLESLGIHGEYTIHFIAQHRERPLGIEALQHSAAPSTALGDNLDAWMSVIAPGLRINAQILTSLNAASLSFRFVQGRQLTRDFRPQNVGFGLTYALPVITAVLAAKPGDLVLIENPESHLHPAGQAELGRLCALAAQHGVQLIIETHSDHFLNGVRVAVRRSEVEPDRVKVYFLERKMDAEAHETTVTQPVIDSDGRFSHWPVGFFDEWDKRLGELL